jgi:hypothetical protein
MHWNSSFESVWRIRNCAIIALATKVHETFALTFFPLTIGFADGLSTTLPILMMMSSKRPKGERRFAAHVFSNLRGFDDHAEVAFAVRCSTAATLFFKPVIHTTTSTTTTTAATSTENEAPAAATESNKLIDSSTQLIAEETKTQVTIEYRDGGLMANNPSLVTLSQLLDAKNRDAIRAQLRPGVSADTIDCFVSLGTGTSKALKSLMENGGSSIMSKLPYSGLVPDVTHKQV